MLFVGQIIICWANYLFLLGKNKKLVGQITNLLFCWANYLLGGLVCWANHLFLLGKLFVFVGQKQKVCWANLLFVGQILFVGQFFCSCWTLFVR